jgi:DNA replication and repair protein RecF
VPTLIQKITLSQFRSYEALRLDTAGASFVVLTGENGAGKTNVLEAVSLLSPGRGLRGAGLDEIMNNKAVMGDTWAVAAELSTPKESLIRIGTGVEAAKKRRAVRVNGKSIKNQAALAEIFSLVWLTPQMDRLFLEGASARRHFLDRLVFAQDPGHATRLGRYEKHLRERMALLQGPRSEVGSWLDILESGLAADAVAIASSRRTLLDRIERHVAELSGQQALFPAPSFILAGWIDDAIQRFPALEVEESMKQKFKQSRAADTQAGKTLEGAHRSDFIVHYAEKNMPATQSSTGEQKALLISIVLAHAMMIRSERGAAPILLLDEIAAHLDDARRDQLFQHLHDLGTQVWMTGTERDIFKVFADQARYFHIGAQPKIPAPMLEAAS